MELQHFSYRTKEEIWWSDYGQRGTNLTSVKHVRIEAQPDGSIHTLVLKPGIGFYPPTTEDVPAIKEYIKEEYVEEPLSKVPFHNKADVPYIKRFVPLHRLEGVEELSSIHVFERLPRNVPEYCELHKHDFMETDTFLSFDGSLKAKVSIEDKSYEVVARPYVHLVIPEGVRHSINIVSGRGIMFFHGQVLSYSGVSDSTLLRRAGSVVESRGINDKNGSDPYKEGRNAIANALDRLDSNKSLGAWSRVGAVLGVMNKIGENSEFMPSLGPLKSKILREKIRIEGPKEILEIGTLFGYSAILMAANLPEYGHVTTIEQNAANALVAKRAMKLAGVDNKISLHVGDALKVLEELDKTKTFDMVLIDGKKDEYLEYLKRIEPHLRPGSIVIADNVGVFVPYMADYLAYVRGSGKYRSNTERTKLEFSDLDDAMEMSIKLR